MSIDENVERCARALLDRLDTVAMNFYMKPQRDALRAALDASRQRAAAGAAAFIEPKGDAQPPVYYAPQDGAPSLSAGGSLVQSSGISPPGVTFTEDASSGRFYFKGNPKPMTAMDGTVRAAPPASATAEDRSRGCVVSFCADHAEVEIVTGPFCPVCSMGKVLDDGVRLGRTAKWPNPVKATCGTCGSKDPKEVGMIGAEVRCGMMGQLSVGSGRRCPDHFHSTPGRKATGP